MKRLINIGLVIYLVFFFYINKAISQHKSDFAIQGGGDVPAFFQFGLRHNFSNWHYDVNFGTWPDSESYGCGANVAYHFGSQDPLRYGEIQQPWYITFGGAYIYDYSFENQDVFVISNIGRDIRISPVFHLSFSTGLMFNVYHFSKEQFLDIYIPILPNAQATLSFRLVRFGKENH